MTTQRKRAAPISEDEKKLVLAELNVFEPTSLASPWNPSDFDKLESIDLKEFRKIVDACRFFYKKDPLASTVINKLIDIGVNKLEFDRNGLTENEFRVFTSIEDKLKEFAEDMALEFLLSGLVMPEVKFAAVTKEDLKALGIKKYDTLQLPISMWVRDPKTVKINKSMISDRPSYFIEVPEDLHYFLTHEGTYPDGNSDKKLYAEILAYYPEFVLAVKNGEKFIPYENDLIFRRRVISDTAYPTPYLYPAIEPMKHKRNLRRMDYALASRVIAAIMLVKMGDKDFPLTDDNKDQLDSLKQQFYHRNTGNKDIDRIFQLFTNHTVSIEWVFPDAKSLLDDTKYKDINQEIIFSLGFPRILITGESEKTGTSDPQYASMSPTKTLEGIRAKILNVLKRIVYDIGRLNSFKNTPIIKFKPLQLSDFQAFVGALVELYDRGNISRETFTEFFGYSWDDEMEKREEEVKVLKDKNLPEFAPTPNSRSPELDKEESEEKDNSKKENKENSTKSS